MDVLDFHVSVRTIPRQQIVDPGAFAVSDFGPDVGGPGQFCHLAGAQGFADNAVGHGCVNPCHLSVRQFHQFPRKSQLALGVAAVFDPYTRAFVFQPQHCTGVGAVHRHFRSVVQNNVRQKPFVSADQAGGDQRAGELHVALVVIARTEDKTMPNPTAAMIVIGDEILSGRTRDANMNHLAKALTEVGINLKEVRVVADEQADIVRAVNALRVEHDHVFTSGGIGPTHDDITADAIGRAFGVAVDVREDALDALAANYPNGRDDLNPARLRMARVPDGAALIENPVSGAPGFSVENVHVMAGVPRIFEAMVMGLLPTLKGGDPVLSANVKVNLPEGEVAGPLAEVAARYPQLSMGSYPFVSPAGYGSNLVVRGTVAEMVERAANELAQVFEASS